ncbi:TadE family protein [Phenylobacterium sp.]|uniref:TadE family protein n=1 Tax=Phenylobacterium sp. TaxID=1871053 RepID=UPI002E37BA04|nr:TadE family protein [Phenylobacterium sp.]HEX4710690.1 TadE family protein [Phenylobacterium sp.]
MIDETRGAAAVELALWISILIVPVLNVADLGLYAYQSMQLRQSAQVAAQAAWKLCDPSQGNYLPAATNCPNLRTTLATAASGTSLGANAVVQTSHEQYYCTNASGGLVAVGTQGDINTSGSNTVPSPPSPNDCSSVVTGSTTRPADYIQITVNYAYSPLFRQVSVVSLLATPISQTAWMRMD